MEIIKFRNLYCKYSKSVNNKFKELQIYLYFIITYNILFEIKRNEEYVYSIDINIFDIFTFNINKDKECHHQGFHFNIKLIMIEFSYCHLDNRHWDYENNCFEI